MTIQEIHNAFNTYFTNRALSFMHGRRSQVNTLPVIDTAFTYPMVVMDPISYTTVNSGLQVQTRIYSVDMAFLDLLAPDATSTQELTIVQEMDTKCAQFLVGIHENVFTQDQIDTTLISDADVQSVFWWQDAANNVAGVTLSFTIETQDTYDYCEIQEVIATSGIGFMTIGTTNIIAA
jgi:hypothetical protein